MQPSIISWFYNRSLEEYRSILKQMLSRTLELKKGLKGYVEYISRWYMDLLIDFNSLLTTEQTRESIKDYKCALLLVYLHVIEVRTLVDEQVMALSSILDTNNLLILRIPTIDELLRIRIFLRTKDKWRSFLVCSSQQLLIIAFANANLLVKEHIVIRDAPIIAH